MAVASTVPASAAVPGEQAAPSGRSVKPAECVLAGPQNAAATVEHGGKTYYLSSQTCKDEFLTDPERYSQLYDALLELKAQGKPQPKPRPPADASLVPS